MRKMIAGLCCTVALGAVLTARAATPLGGLAVAVSKSGGTLVCAGDNRTLYVINAANMEVGKRVWLGVPIISLSFGADDSTLLLEDTDGTLHLYSVETWEPLKKLPKHEHFCIAAEGALCAALKRDYSQPQVMLLSAADLSEKGAIALDKEERVQALTLNPTGNRLAVLMESTTDSSEPKNSVPKELKGLELDEFRLKNDGKTTLFKIYEVPSGKVLAEHKLYYSPSGSGCHLLFRGDNVLAVNYSNLNAEISPTGEVRLFKLSNSFNYGTGAAADHSVLLSGGMASGTYTKVADMGETTFKCDKVAGWPEYFKSFAVSTDGIGYGGTSAYRIIKIKPDGSFDKAVPIF